MGPSSSDSDEDMERKGSPRTHAKLRPMDVTFVADLPKPAAQTITELVQPLVTLEHVVKWSLTLEPIQIGDVISQDEYTVDVVMPYNNLWLVFDST